MRAHGKNPVLSVRRRPDLNGFSLVELLLAMAVLSVLMLLLFKFFANMQMAWTTSMNTTQVYEDARVVLDVITHDLQSALSKPNDIPGQHIRFHQESPNSLWFVTVGDPNQNAKSTLIEVGYRKANHCFERAVVDDAANLEDDSKPWNIYGNRDAADNQNGYQKVVSGVLAETFICYDQNMTPYVPTQQTELPNMISVTLNMMDSKSFKVWKQLYESYEQQTAEQAKASIKTKLDDLEKKVTRTFHKTIFLGNRKNQTP